MSVTSLNCFSDYKVAGIYEVCVCVVMISWLVSCGFANIRVPHLTDTIFETGANGVLKSQTILG